VPIGMLRPETLTPVSALTSDATHGLLEFVTLWQHWGVLVDELPEPPFGAGAATARVAKPARARVKTLANMAIGECWGGRGEVRAAELGGKEHDERSFIHESTLLATATQVRLVGPALGLGHRPRTFDLLCTDCIVCCRRKPNATHDALAG
jgi:hypothetical protein